MAATTEAFARHGLLTVAAVAALSILASTSAAQTSSPIPLLKRPELLSTEAETRMALAAAPAHLRDGAAVYVLHDTGFVMARPSSNGFSCIVNRDHPMNRKPTCYDAEGTATILPKVLYYGHLLMKEMPVPEILREIADGFKSGKFISPRRAGVAYMLSGDVQVYNASAGTLGSFPPHVMVYAPNVTNADIGTTNGALNDDPHLPFVGYQGPHGYIIVMMPHDMPGTTKP
jgi:hypothetical protein